MSASLPLGWTRVVVLALFFVLSIVSSAYCIKMFTMNHDEKMRINKAVPPGVKVDLQYTDVQGTAIATFIAMNIVTLVSSHIVLAFLQDKYRVIPDRLARRFGIPDKNLSTSTLPLQTFALLFSAVFAALSVSFMTAFVFTRERTLIVTSGSMQVAGLTVQATLDQLGIKLAYRDTPYISVVPKVSWPAIIFAIPSVLITAIAWRRRPASESDEVNGKLQS